MSQVSGNRDLETESVTMYDHLHHQHEVAQLMTNEELAYAIADVNHSLRVWRGVSASHPYVVKLYREFDAYTVERNRRIIRQAAA